MVATTFHKPPPAPSLPPKPAGRNQGLIHDDSSWITKPSDPQRTKKSIAMKGMTRAFVESMRCSLEEAECKTSKEERIDSIDFGKLLVALDVMKDCMKIYGMTRTPADLEHHSSNAKMLHMATPPESRDYLSCLLQSSESKQEGAKSNSGKNKDNNNNHFNMPFVRAFSISTSQDESIALPRAQSCAPELLTHDFAAAMKKDASTSLSHRKRSDQPPPCLLDASDRKKARNSMFWLCYFVRYTYNVHRLVLQIGHDTVDASPTAFMQNLHPHFLEYYTETRDAKAYLKLLTDYQNEHFLGAATSGGKGIHPEAMLDLKSFLGVLEIVMYLWTPAFQEMALQ